MSRSGKKLEYQLDKETDYELAAEQELRFEVENDEKVSHRGSLHHRFIAIFLISSQFLHLNRTTSQP